MGHVLIQGEKYAIQAELSTLLFSLLTEKVLEEKDIRQAVEQAIIFKPEDFKDIKPSVILSKLAEVASRFESEEE